MPTRVIRGSLLTSDRWLALRDNTARVCFVACVLTADDCGNMEGSIPHLRRIWRDYGVDTEERVNRTLAELVDTDLVRIYPVDNKQFIHIPRFGQALRYLKRRNPGSPWDDNQKIQHLGVNSQCDSTVNTLLSHSEVKRSEEKRREVELKRSDAEGIGNRALFEWATSKGIKALKEEGAKEFKARIEAEYLRTEPKTT